MLCCPCTGPTTVRTRKRPRFTSGSISIAAFPRKSSSATARKRNGLLSRGFWRRGKQASWIEAIRAISSLTPGKLTASIISAGSKPPRKRPSSERMTSKPTALSFMTPSFFWGLTVQMLAGLITYILLAIYCHDQHHEKVSVKRLREISINIRNEMSIEDIVNETGAWIYQPPNQDQLYANP